MNAGCRRYRGAIRGHSVQPWRADPAGDLAVHLATCARCAEAARQEERLDAALSTLADDPAPRIDVRDRVLLAIARPSVVVADELRPFAWAGLAGLIAGGLLLAAAWWLRVDFGTLLSRLPVLASGLGDAFLALGRAIAEVLGAVVALATSMLGALAGLGALGRALAPAGIGALILAHAAMAATILYTVGRDLWFGARQERST